MKKLSMLFLLAISSYFSFGQANVLLVSGAGGSFTIDGQAWPTNSITLNVYRDSSYVELDKVSPCYGSDCVVRPLRAITKFYVNGVHVTTLAQLRNFYGTYMASSASGGAAGGDLTGNYPNPTIGARKVTVSKISATGTPSSSTYLRGDGTWSAAGSGIPAGTPTLTVNSNAGIDATATLEAGSNNQRGVIYLTTGTSGVAGGGTFVTINFSSALSSAPIVLISVANDEAVAILLDPSVASGFYAAAPGDGTTTSSVPVKLYQVGLGAPVPTNAFIKLFYVVTP